MKNLKNEKSHVLIALFPGQGQINPRLQFSKQLINLGIGVTLTTSLSAFSKIKKLPSVEGLSFAPFSDGYDGKFQSSSIDEFHLFSSSVKSCGSKFIFNLIQSNAKNGTPFSHVIYTIIMEWVGLVAKKINIPSTLFWIQPATVFDDIIIELPGFPPFSPIDFPSFVFDDVESSNWAVKSIKRQIEMLSSEKNPRVLVNTFNALKILKHVTMMGIGHSIPSIFLDDNTFRANMIEISSKNYMDWLNSMDKGLVIYIAFDSYSEISSQLMDKIAHELLKYGRPFLWVIREGKDGYKMEDKLSCKDELEKQGKIVSWYSQVDVLNTLLIMENLKNDCHVLLVTFPGQGHINPSLQFAKKLVNLGIKVTVSTSLTAFNRISKLPNIEGLSFTPFSDGYDGKFKGSLDEFESFYSSLVSHGSEFVTQIIESRVVEGHPFKRVIYTTLMAWVGIVAKGINVPSTFFWIQPATVLDIYYYCFTDYADCFKNCSQDQVVDLPGLPRLSPRDFPSFVFTDVNSNYGWGVKSIIDQIELLNSEENHRVLVNTFDDLEFDALRALKNLTMVGIGPSIPSAFLDGNDPLDKPFGADLRRSLENYMDWLDAMTKESIIYIAFGSYSEISSLEEIGQGLIKCGRPFLWELEKQGKIVHWCSQVEVLQHPSLGCFLTHCGWNSTLESLSSGMPIVVCPLWTDQGCNAKLVQDHQ
ncbi:hypothetical protein H5410_049268 [Solanum commersonii]|uniref:Uncharacterized protein n=1 Tax=Solanum commersonii TaxID=4109 RepID=A0A9J5XM12_SOLCO|nr:hypothetical protein H5410_049268 [Solanum commersonii]